MFTDDDLKRLKGQLPRGKWTQHLTQDNLEALLARLEAAELLVKHFKEEIIDADCESWDSEGAEKAYEAWRKAAGK